MYVYCLFLLGEGEFGEVWKAIAPGIVPGNQARNVVAVKHVKGSIPFKH